MEIISLSLHLGLRLTLVLALCAHLANRKHPELIAIIATIFFLLPPIIVTCITSRSSPAQFTQTLPSHVVTRSSICTITFLLTLVTIVSHTAGL